MRWPITRAMILRAARRERHDQLDRFGRESCAIAAAGSSHNNNPASTVRKIFKQASLLRGLFSARLHEAQVTSYPRVEFDAVVPSSKGQAKLTKSFCHAVKKIRLEWNCRHDLADGGIRSVAAERVD
jgi:hypothetical protein